MQIFFLLRHRDPCHRQPVSDWSRPAAAGPLADLAGAFGGQGSQTAFGPRAAANVLTKLTSWSR